MIRFLLKGLLRDRSRSLFPLITVFSGVLLTVFLHAWIQGAMSSVIQSTAHYMTGHVRVTTAAYAKEADQIPNDLALLGIDTLIASLRRDYPDIFWTPRIKFGGLLDIPDEHHETRVQTPVSGIAADLLSEGSPDRRCLDVGKALVKGRALRSRGEVVIGDELAEKLRVAPGDTVTLMTSTMYGSMSLTNFVLVGTVRFGIVAMDRGTVIADISDIQKSLDMTNGAGEILGLFGDDIYHEDRANAVTAAFNARLHGPTPGDKPDPFYPVMGTLRTTGGLSDYIDMVELYSVLIVVVFTVAMSIVLWNAGLTGSLRRYGEIGVRLALGEDKTHVYRTLLGESVMIGLGGSLLGTGVGVGLSYYLQSTGLDIGSIMTESTMMVPNIIRAEVTPFTYAIGFLPGLLATILGTAISGLGIYERQTSELFKELGT